MRGARISFCKRSQHDGAVGNGLVSRDFDFPVQGTSPLKFSDPHILFSFSASAILRAPILPALFSPDGHFFCDTWTGFRAGLLSCLLR